MYGLAGFIVELLANSSWEDFITERVFKPLNMTDSTFVNKIDVNSKRLSMAKPYVHKNNITSEIDLTSIRYVSFEGDNVTLSHPNIYYQI